VQLSLSALSQLAEFRPFGKGTVLDVQGRLLAAFSTTGVLRRPR
jgi:hypothetical protein